MTTQTYTEPQTASEWTRQTMWSDLRQQPMLLAGAGLAVFATLLFWMRRQPSQERAARHLVRDWRDVDDIDDARDLLGSNIPAIMRPALMVLLEQGEDQVHRWFRQMERSISKM
jgi:hypothetical protein